MDRWMVGGMNRCQNGIWTVRFCSSYLAGTSTSWETCADSGFDFFSLLNTDCNEPLPIKALHVRVVGVELDNWWVDQMSSDWVPSAPQDLPLTEGISNSLFLRPSDLWTSWHIPIHLPLPPNDKHIYYGGPWTRPKLSARLHLWRDVNRRWGVISLRKEYTLA